MSVRSLTQLVSLACIIATSVWIGRSCGRPTESVSDERRTSQTLVLQEIVAMGKLELVKYNFKDVVEHQIVREWLPDPRAVLIVSGEAIGCLDLAKITPADIIQTPGDTLLLYLPEPELCVNKINHEQSKVYNTEYLRFEDAPGQLVTEAFAKAEKQIGTSALEMGILAQTKQNADKILRPLLEKISGRTVLLRYRLRVPINTRR